MPIVTSVDCNGATRKEHFCVYAPIEMGRSIIIEIPLYQVPWNALLTLKEDLTVGRFSLCARHSKMKSCVLPSSCKIETGVS